jgi:hypothetical protein
MPKWVCSLDACGKVYNKPPSPDNPYCPNPAFPEWHGLLIEETDDDPAPSGATITTGTTGAGKTEAGLCVMMMDASASMEKPAFKGSPITKMRLISDSAAMGIFDLKGIRNPNAVIAAFMFDDRVKPIFMDTIMNLVANYRDVKTFSDFIYQNLQKMKQGTDINLALRTAHNFVRDFINGKLSDFPVKNYKPLPQYMLTHDDKPITVPNIRVLIYTDGQQFDKQDNRILKPNPFQTEPLPGLDYDIVIGAFFGKPENEGYDELKSILSKCPKDNVLQFFSFDKPANAGDMRYLFRMASGASGFCPECLNKQLNRNTSFQSYS